MGHAHNAKYACVCASCEKSRMPAAVNRACHRLIVASRPLRLGAFLSPLSFSVLILCAACAPAPQHNDKRNEALLGLAQQRVLPVQQLLSAIVGGDINLRVPRPTNRDVAQQDSSELTPCHVVTLSYLDPAGYLPTQPVPDAAAEALEKMNSTREAQRNVSDEVWGWIKDQALNLNPPAHQPYATAHEWLRQQLRALLSASDRRLPSRKAILGSNDTLGFATPALRVLDSAVRPSASGDALPTIPTELYAYTLAVSASSLALAQQRAHYLCTAIHGLGYASASECPGLKQLSSGAASLGFRLRYFVRDDGMEASGSLGSSPAASIPEPWCTGEVYPVAMVRYQPALQGDDDDMQIIWKRIATSMHATKVRWPSPDLAWVPDPPIVALPSVQPPRQRWWARSR